MKNLKNIDISVVGPGTRFLSGISYYTIRLCNALSLHSTVHAVLFRNMLPKRLFPGWKRVGRTDVALSISSSIHVYEGLDWYNPFSWAKGARQIRRSQVVILEWWTSSVVHMFLALVLLAGRKRRVIIEFHEVVDPLEYAVLPLRIYAKTMAKIIRGSAFRFIVHSEHDQHLIASQYHISPSNIAIIPHGLYDQYPVLNKNQSRSELNLTKSYIILFFGLIRPYKGLSLLIHAFENLPQYVQQNTLLLIAGEAWEDRESLDLINGSPARDHIRLENRYISDEEIPRFFSSTDLLVLPYTRASQSGVAHIGIAYGLPIIASKVGGLCESLGSYSGTTFIDPSDVNALVQAIEGQFNHPVQERFSPPEEMRWERVAERYLAEAGFAGDM